MPRHRLLGSVFPTFQIAHTRSLFKAFEQALPGLKSSVLCAFTPPRSISADSGKCLVMPRPLTVSRAGQGLVSLGLVFDRVPIEMLQHKYMPLPMLPPSVRGRARAVQFFLKMARQHSHLCEMQMLSSYSHAPNPSVGPTASRGPPQLLRWVQALCDLCPLWPPPLCSPGQLLVSHYSPGPGFPSHALPVRQSSVPPFGPVR